MGAGPAWYAAIGAAALALVLAVAALAARPRDCSAELARIQEGIDALTRGADARASARDAASALIADLAARIDALERSLAEVREASRQRVEPQAVREALREEVRRGFDQLRRGRPGGELTAETLRDQLGIDEAKADMIVALRREMGEQIAQVWRDNRGAGRDDNIRVMNELRDRMTARIGELLTPEQLERYRALDVDPWRRGRRGEDPERGGDERAVPPPEDRPVF